MPEKIVITGMSIISSLGFTLEENWSRLCAGNSGVAPITLFDPSGLQTRIAAQLPDSFDEFSRQLIRKRASGQMTRVTRMAVTAAVEAMKHAGIDRGIKDRSRGAVVMGIVNTGNSSAEKGTTLQNTIFKSMTNAIPAWISMEFGMTGPAYAINTACASSAYAIANGCNLIRSGQADLVIAGGADSIINFEEISGFNALYALSVANDPPEKASKPFSLDRDGFVIGEGAGVVVLESHTHARNRDAAIHAQIAGCSLTSEAYNIMAPMKDGEGMADTMQRAIRDAGLVPDDIDYINAHGTSTELNDRFETMAIKKVFGEKAYSIPVSSTKSMIGHTIGAAGVIENIVTALSLKHGILTPTINYDIPDPDLDLDYIPNRSRYQDIRTAISNSFGFGGHNATLVLTKWID